MIIHARESFFLKKKDIPISIQNEIKSHFTHYFFEEKACNECELKVDRLKSETKLTPTCTECAAFLGGAQLASDVKLGTTKYLKTPAGNLRSLERILDRHYIDYTVKDHHPVLPMRRKMKFTGSYRGEYQKEAVTAILQERRGVIKAPPRSGKTVIASAAVCKLGLKTFIIASQREWLLGFKETFIGSKTQTALTDCRPSQIGFARTLADFKKYDICLVTVQTFYSERGQRLLKKVRDMASVAIVDEIHTGAAPKYATILNSLNCSYVIGLSGTPSRKDGRYVLMRNIVGPNIYEAKVERLRPTIRLTRTQYVNKAKQGMVPWVRLVSGIEKDKDRLKLIAKWAVKDAEAGHMVLIPFAQITPIKALVKAINIMAGSTIAKPFHGGLKKTDRDLFIEQARNYEIKILVGNVRLLSVGTNIPRASALYEQVLSSNLENAEQRFSRILTPYDGKPTPLMRYFLDDSSVRRRCLNNEFWQVLMKKFRPIISDRDLIMLKSYLSGKDKDSGPIQM